jgi:hypothetical protein
LRRFVAEGAAIRRDKTATWEAGEENCGFFTPRAVKQRDRERTLAKAAYVESYISSIIRGAAARRAAAFPSTSVAAR